MLLLLLLLLVVLLLMVVAVLLLSLLLLLLLKGPCAVVRVCKIPLLHGCARRPRWHRGLELHTVAVQQCLTTHQRRERRGVRFTGVASVRQGQRPRW